MTDVRSANFQSWQEMLVGKSRTGLKTLYGIN
jgi:hypothetical protein